MASTTGIGSINRDKLLLISLIYFNNFIQKEGWGEARGNFPAVSTMPRRGALYQQFSGRKSCGSISVLFP